MRFLVLIIFMLQLALPVSAKVGEMAEQFVLKDMNGRLVNSASYIGKQPVLLMFWASW
ncbi:MAG: hypothetical protein HOL93_07640 [Candidatus Marinimicrobia bacterium]|jgi:peroxiredoxin|nr:hypothetical protein [Candidatus Neomarinimicrobiota bacterium]